MTDYRTIKAPRGKRLNLEVYSLEKNYYILRNIKSFQWHNIGKCLRYIYIADVFGGFFNRPVKISWTVKEKDKYV